MSGKAPPAASAGAAAAAFRPATAGPEWLGGDKQAGEPVPWDQLTPEQFSTVADWYLSRLWMRVEKGLRLALGEEFAYEIQPQPGAMLVLLPYDGQLIVRKDAEARTLVVESNLFEPFEDKDRIEFKPRAEDQWESEDGDSLPDFAAEAMSRYLKATVRL
ncbi:ribosomal RNA assembly [Micractinium conductrix]|uniref:Ribosomal RNA assembly n=1 Tax=Micractinium conductrix TaxID=554055 RepID=A0A2P6VGG6_9CHLO|nr:ribosomal RNA assembly [Micractinium conductrix]|eukprot:PSC73184.1 ribosomal RNA assembly [Micractinium conductrix]